MTDRTDADRIAEIERRNVAEAIAELLRFREGTRRDLEGLQPGEFREHVRDAWDECELVFQEMVMSSAGDGAGKARH
jgi:hypothetical protein